MVFRCKLCMSSGIVFNELLIGMPYHFSKHHPGIGRDYLQHVENLSIPGKGLIDDTVSELVSDIKKKVK